MADEFIKVEGLQEVKKALYSFSQKLGDLIIIKALREGARGVQKEIQRRAPVYKGKPIASVKSGTLKKGFKIAKSKIHNGRMSDDMIGVYLTLRKGNGRKDPRDPFYGKFIEGGFRNKKGIFFIQGAFDAKKEEAANVIVRAATIGADLLARKEGL